MTVAENFKAFRDRYIIGAELEGTISNRYKRITKQLNKDFRNSESETANSIYVGSYGRNTAALGVSDLDIAFILPNQVYAKYDAYQSNGQSALLQAVKNSLLKTYSSSYIGGDGQVVAINFSDNVRFEILPVFLNSAESFTFADSNDGGRWRTCNPRAEMKAFADRNTLETNGNLVALCRMTRIWRDFHSVPIGGMLIDTLAYKFIENWAYCDKSYLYHDFLIRDFLLYLANTPSDQTYWLAPGSNSYVYSKGNFQKQAASSYQAALLAIDHDANERPTTARNKWREIFGATYP